jgi:hypothetical protein
LIALPVRQVGLMETNSHGESQGRCAVQADGTSGAAGLDFGRRAKEGNTMVETTILVVAGKRLPMPRFFKRVLQVAIAVALTAGVFFVMIVGNGFLLGRGASFQAGLNLWLTFIKRPEILTTMVLTAFVTVLFVYWQRNQERRAGAPSRPAVPASR